MNFLELHHGGTAAFHAGRFTEAEELWRRALEIEPRAVGTRTNHGVALHELGRYDEAVACYDHALMLAPDHAEAHSNRTRTLIELHRYVEALRSAERAIALQQGYVDAWINLAAAQKALSRFDEALKSTDWALMLSPGRPEALIARGNVLIELNRHDEALALFEALLIEAPSLNVHIQQGVCYQAMARHRDAIACFDRALALKPDALDVISNKIFALDFIPEATVELQQQARKAWARQAGAKPVHAVSRRPASRIVLGYVSSDFRRHSAATTFWPVLAHHDHGRFEVICYSSSIIRDDVTRDFVQAADRFIDVSQHSTKEIVARVRDDKVDILIDLSGHSGGSRLPVFVDKPAPVQVTAWGHATGTGLNTIDYLFSDPVTIPPAVRHHFAERIIDLPCALTISLPATFVTPRERYVWPMFMFGVFQRFSKISAEAVAAWAEILHRVPAARLLMKDGAYDEALRCAEVRQRFVAHGIAGERIAFLGSSTREQHLVAMGQLDVALDPFPHNGGVSTWEALTQGVPVVALLGTTPSSRIAAAILASLDLHDWIAGNVEEYVTLAVTAAQQPYWLNEVREELPGLVARAPSGNAVLYTRAVEQAYLEMVSRAGSGS